MEIAIVVVIIIVLFIVVANSGNSSKTINKETEQQRQSRLQSEQAERNRQAEISKQQQVERERQVELQRQQAQEQQRRQVEQARILEQRRIAEQQRLQVERQRQQTANYKTNWQDFQQVFQQNGITKLYHFTDRANLPSIRSNGGLYSWWEADRLGIEIPMPGGIGFGRDLDRRYGLENFVRICFTKQHPMLFIAKREGRIVNPIILEINLEVSYLKETRFCNMNATRNGHKQGKEIENLNNIRFDLVKQTNHFDISEVEKHFYQAEILVLQKVPLEYITNINSV